MAIYAGFPEWWCFGPIGREDDDPGSAESGYLRGVAVEMEFCLYRENQVMILFFSSAVECGFASVGE